jgi:hypothetical protein
VALCNIMSSETKSGRKVVPPFPPQPALGGLPSMTDRIAAFLDGRTHGEDLLHELYDYVLEEPLPQRLREILDRERGEPDQTL